MLGSAVSSLRTSVRWGKVLCNYVAKLLDGTVFDSADSSPVTLTPGELVKGWAEAMMLMRPGDVWRLWIPSSLGYGEHGKGIIPSDAVLEITLTVIAVGGHAEKVAAGQPGHAAEMAAGSDAAGSYGFFGEMLNREILNGMIPGVKLWHVAIFVAITQLLKVFFAPDDGERVSARHILVDAEAAASELKLKVEADGGGSAAVVERFAAAAKAHSTCPSKSNGGSLGTFSRGQMVPAFDAVCFDPSYVASPPWLLTTVG